MSATVIGNKIYVSNKLKEQLTQREYRVLLAHEVGHFMSRDRLKIMSFMTGIVLATTACFYFGQFIAGVIMMVSFKPAVDMYRRYVELNADRYALLKTKDFDAFISLMDKLDHNGSTHPGKADRIGLATNMRNAHE